MNRYLKAALFGALGGVAGIFVMDKVMAALSKKPMRTKPELRAAS